jgi:hypothetical protein
MRHWASWAVTAIFVLVVALHVLALN